LGGGSIAFQFCAEPFLPDAQSSLSSIKATWEPLRCLFNGLKSKGIKKRNNIRPKQRFGPIFTPNGVGGSLRGSSVVFSAELSALLLFTDEVLFSSSPA